jgi:hypothetical protein
MRKILNDLAKDRSPQNIKANRNGKLVDLGLVNQFALHKFIPNKWFDWERSQNAKYMIIGQDWGPYVVLKKLIEEFDQTKANDKEYYRQFILGNFSSRTETFIANAIKSTYLNKFGSEFQNDQWDDILFTMSVLFTRQGKHFRGSHNFDAKKSFDISYPYVARQIEFVKPKVILTLGSMAFEVVNQVFELGYKDNLTQIIKSLEPNKTITLDNGTKIIPNFHPASYTPVAVQLDIWSKLWE